MAHETVVLVHDHFEHGLRAGDVGTIIHLYDNAAVCDVEFAKADGRPVAILTLSLGEVRRPTSNDLLHVRHV